MSLRNYFFCLAQFALYRPQTDLKVGMSPQSRNSRHLGFSLIILSMLSQLTSFMDEDEDFELLKVMSKKHFDLCSILAVISEIQPNVSAEIYFGFCSSLPDQSKSVIFM